MNSKDASMRMCVGDFGPKIHEMRKCDPRQEFSDNRKQKRTTFLFFEGKLWGSSPQRMH